jgi:hypothetical protein
MAFNMTFRAQLISLLLLIILPAIWLMSLFFSRILTGYQEQSSQNQSIAIKMVGAELDDLIDTIQYKMQSISLENVLGV